MRRRIDVALGFGLIKRSHQQNFGEGEAANRVLRDIEHRQIPLLTCVTSHVACQTTISANTLGQVANAENLDKAVFGLLNVVPLLRLFRAIEK